MPISTLKAIPAFENIKIVDENGYLTSGWRAILQDLLQVLQYKISDDGFVIPSRTAAELAQFDGSPNGTMVYDSTNDLAKIKIAGTFETITTT